MPALLGRAANDAGAGVRLICVLLSAGLGGRVLPADQARRVRVILALIGFGLDAARAASAPVDRTAAIASVEAQLVALHAELRD